MRRLVEYSMMPFPLSPYSPRSNVLTLVVVECMALCGHRPFLFVRTARPRRDVPAYIQLLDDLVLRPFPRQNEHFYFNFYMQLLWVVAPG